VTTEDDRARVRGYLTSQAEKYGLLELWPRIAAQRLVFLQEIDGLTDAQARWRATPDEWSVLDTTRHLAVWTDGVVAICNALVSDGPMPSLKGGDLGTIEYAGLAEARQALTRASLGVASFMMLDESTFDLTRTHQHGLFGPLNVKAWLLFLRIHDTDHIGQGQSIKQAAGFPAG